MEKEQIFREIAKKHIPVLKNKNLKNRKLIIAFAGIPGSGKTTLAKVLEKKYKGVRINSSVIGGIIKKLNLKDDAKHSLQNQYQMWLVKSGLIKNGLIILDSGIERKYLLVKKTAKQSGHRLFVICLKVPKKVLIQRIKKREKEKARVYLKEMKRWTSEFNEFNRKFRSDVVVDGSRYINYKPLRRKLDTMFAAASLL